MEFRQVKANSRSNVKTLAAVIGGSAVVATLALSLAIDQEQRGPVTVLGSTMATGVTSTAGKAVDGAGDVYGCAVDEGPRTAALRGAVRPVAAVTPLGVSPPVLRLPE